MRKLLRQAIVIHLCVALAMGLGPVAAVAQSDDLPSLGSPSDALLSKAEEARIGRSIYASLYNTGKIVTDPEIQEYIQDVGQTLAPHAQDGDYQFQFFVVDDPVINAFALPGGYIGVHSGLVMATETESELAGVLAHEIAHVTQRHISRAVYANQRASILTMAALLGAILVGVAGGSGDMVMGGIAASQSMAAQQQINFTRSNEYEADRVGVGTLTQAGYDPNGMPDFFETMARGQGASAVMAPEFLSTHPVTTNRIAETRSRIDELAEVDVTDSVGYSVTRSRLRVLTARTPGAALEWFEGEMQDPEKVGDAGLEYGIAMANLEMGEAQTSEEIYRRLLASDPGIIPYHTGLGQSLLAQDEEQEAMAVYRHAMGLFPRSVPLTIRYAEAELEYGDPEVAHKVLLDLLNNVPPTPDQVRLIALAASEAGDVADAHYYMAEYHLLRGNLGMAADQLQLALSIPGLDNVQRERFQARLQKVNGWMREAEAARRRQRQG